MDDTDIQSIFSPFGAIRACVMAAVSPLEPRVVGESESLDLMMKRQQTDVLATL